MEYRKTRLTLAIAKKIADQPWLVLGPLELKVFMMLAIGEKPKKIAKAMSISPKTVAEYKARIMYKLELESSSDITAFALKYKMISGTLRVTFYHPQEVVSPLQTPVET